MKYITLLLTFSLISNVGLSQNWAPTGATWYYEIVHPFSPTLTYAKYVSIGDTNILGRNCKIIQQTVGANSWDFLIGRISTAYTYELNSKIYVYNASNSNFSLIYDFAADSGDTWITSWDTCTYTRIIHQTDSILINGIYLKTLANGSLIEHIGGTRTLFHGIGEVKCDPPDTIISELPFVQRLRCYEDSIIGFYSTGISPACDFITTAEQVNKLEIYGTIFPNPASSKIHFRLDNRLQSTLILNFYNSLGQLIDAVNIADENTSIDISTFEPGVYLLVAVDNSGIRLYRKLIINAP